MSNENSQDYSTPKIKIVVLGESKVGKSALIFRYLKGEFPKKHDPTVEDTYKVEKEDLKYDVEILDTAGEKDYQSVIENWINDGNCFILVYSIDDENSFKELDAKYEKICQIKKNEIFSIILVGNKCDLKSERKVTEEEGKKFAKSKGILFSEASALEDFNAKDVFLKVIKDYLKKLKDKKNEWCSCC